MKLFFVGSNLVKGGADYVADDSDEAESGWAIEDIQWADQKQNTTLKS